MEGEQKNTNKAKRTNSKSRAQSTSRRTSARQKQTRPGTGISRATRASMKSLTPDRLKALWELHHPERPEIRSALERLYRLPY